MLIILPQKYEDLLNKMNKAQPRKKCLKHPKDLLKLNKIQLLRILKMRLLRILKMRQGKHQMNNNNYMNNNNDHFLLPNLQIRSLQKMWNQNQMKDQKEKKSVKQIKHNLMKQMKYLIIVLISTLNCGLKNLTKILKVLTWKKKLEVQV